MDVHAEEPITDRQARIVEIVTAQGFATLENLARTFGVSTQSVRRDIIRLDADGLLQRFHGGVGVRETAVRLGYNEKQTVAMDAKRRIAEHAASLIPEGSVVFLDVGTTVEAVAEALRKKGRLRIFTSSLAAAGLLAGRTGIDLFVLGGAVRGIDGSVVGETTIAMLGRLRFDFAVIGFSGVDRDGTPMDYDLEKVAVKQAAIEQAASTLVVGDSSKFRKTAVVRFATANPLVFVTEARPPDSISDKVLGQVVVAEPRA
ncbi:DeoR/GlpR family DNA-binding transcription regulator [Devosia sp.]|uniref:DeoR/GlpR family DNA-binding transcription regulator n=1 Tax=Devosia sp. TaxID=1871048 RepID=UPI001AD31C04|nr:DeoR/GlpR family DNA-binding transcription regulator [Devosia sp.]MBN9309841.1 DeoR/GlpR transcriptional regulator [Devosia sp.]